MNKRYLIPVCLVLWAGAAIAQIDPNDNGIGIYADMDALTNQIALEVGKPLEVYVLMTHPTGAAALGAWECGIVVPDNAAIWGYSLPIAGSVLISTPPAFMVGLPRLLPYEDVMHLMTLIITPLDCYPAQFFIQEYPNA